MDSLPCTPQAFASGRGPSKHPLLLAASYQQVGSDRHMAESRIAEQRTFSAAAGPAVKVIARSANKHAEIIDRIGNPLGFNLGVSFSRTTGGLNRLAIVLG